MIGDDLKRRWLDFTNFVSVPANQAWVGRGTNADGAVAYVKVHTEVAAFQREYTAYQRLQAHDVSPSCLAVEPSQLKLLIADAGQRFGDEAQTGDVGRAMWSVLQRMHAVAVPDDPMPMAAALRLRWDRVSHRLGVHCSAALNAWMLNRLEGMPDVPRAMVHRDLRPSHWFRHGPDVRLIDFGQARVDAVLFDAVPFYTGLFASSIESFMRAQFELTYGAHVMRQVDIFAVLYLCGTVERIVYLDDVVERQRARLLNDSLVKWSNAPLDFGETLAEGT